jgi:hypothetical protein
LNFQDNSFFSPRIGSALYPARGLIKTAAKKRERGLNRKKYSLSQGGNNTPFLFDMLYYIIYNKVHLLTTGGV